MGMYFLIHGRLHISEDDILLPAVTEHHSLGSKKLKALKKATGRNASNSFTEFTSIGAEPIQIDVSEGHVLSPPGFVGAVGLFQERPLPYTISCLTHVELLTLSKAQVDDLRVEFPSLATYMECFERESVNLSQNGQPCGLADCSISELAEK